MVREIKMEIMNVLVRVRRFSREWELLGVGRKRSGRCRF